MCKKTIPLMFMLLFVLISSVNAANITWVAQNWDADGDGVNDSNEWVVKLRAEGYDVDFKTNGYWNDLTQAKVDELNAADLVIVSGTIQSGTFATNAAEVTLWNSVTAPMLNCNPYLIRNTRWKWINNGDSELPNNNGDQGSPDMVVVKATHSIFKGITLTNNKVKVVDPDLGTGHASFVNTASVGNGTLIAKADGNEWLWIAEWPKGVDFYSGAGAKANGHRMYVSIGYHEGSGFGARGYNLTDAGWEIYLNIIHYMLGEPIEPGMARSPSPANGAIDIFNNQTLSWKPGVDAKKHYVFLSTDFNDVNDATIAGPLGTIFSGELDVNNFDPGLLDLESTYYWRVDEALSSSAVIRGKIWKFTVEDAALKMLPKNIIKVTAISSLSSKDPNDVANEAGLDPNTDQHTTKDGQWASTGLDTNDVWIKFDFDRQYRIHEMMVWNYNHSIFYQYGFKEVIVQYSEDGNDVWKAVPDINEFNIGAKGKEDYVYNTTVKFNDVLAKSVRIIALSNWKTSSSQYKSCGLAEIRFTYIPVWPRNLSPADDATDVPFNAKLTWRRGREALTHNLYFDTNEVNVEDRTVTPVVLEVTSYSPVLRLGKTYYWCVDEVNNDMIPSVWSSDVMSFKTPSTILIEGFETGYGNTIGTDTVFDTWLDGAVDSFNGAWMGRDSSPFLHVINHSGGHSAPMKYNNESYSYSEVTADTSKLQNDSDWSIGLPSTLTIWFRGDSNTVEVGDLELYCKIGGQTVVYDGSLDVLMTDMWRQFDINLDTLGLDLSNIPTITIGIKKVGSQGSKGVIYLDDIMLTGAEAVIAYPEILVEAEDYTTILAPMEVNDVIDGAYGGKCIHVKTGTVIVDLNEPPTDGNVTYKVDLEAGQYVIWGRVIAPSANEDSFWVSIDGAATSPNLSDPNVSQSGWCKWNSIPTGANWHWDDVHHEANTTTVKWTIPGGMTTIRIAYREDGANPAKLDALLIQKVGE